MELNAIQIRFPFLPSFPRKREPSVVKSHWVPAFAGTTVAYLNVIWGLKGLNARYCRRQLAQSEDPVSANFNGPV
ncbi:hypothetical protein CBM2634_B100044 [Cupriavidus taiwanensis]|uniref:Uncharacterized protein n=1 Tax=Cupriavidus taiwanensis TaxID=164546 RepID=A0A375J4Y7_9BURK|nr:hypothetical protein CBM2634_B100044 [Cupriavidus taiwanensis]